MTERRRPCDRAEARARVRKARDFLELAEVAISGGLNDPAASDAVLAGIHAADALCCIHLRERSAGESHEEAIEFVGRADPPSAATLRGLLRVKHRAQYDHRGVGAAEATAAVRRARVLVERALEAIAAT